MEGEDVSMWRRFVGDEAESLAALCSEAWFGV